MSSSHVNVSPRSLSNTPWSPSNISGEGGRGRRKRGGGRGRREREGGRGRRKREGGRGGGRGKEGGGKMALNPGHKKRDTLFRARLL